MDKHSIKVLKYIASNKSVSRKTIVGVFGDSALTSLNFLEAEGYIESGKIPGSVDRNLNVTFKSNGIFSITSKGLAFLEEKPGKDFDRWLTRIIAIWGAITGTAALVIEVVLHFL